MYGTEDDRQTKLIRLNLFDPPHLLTAAPDFQDQTYNVWVTATRLVEMTHIAETSQPLLNIILVKGRNIKAAYYYYYYYY